MRLRSLVAVALFPLIAGAALAAARPASSARPSAGAKGATGAPAPSPRRPSVEAQPGADQFLPDTFALCRVGSRVERVRDFVSDYFASYAEFRPSPDSAGRVQFLDNIIHKNLLGLVALEINRPLTFEDRATLREAEQRALANALYRTSVMDSLGITEDDIRHEYEDFRFEYRLRHILFPDRFAAERVRLDLLRGRIGWKEAYERYSLSKGKDKGPDGELGWMVRGGLSLDFARKIFSLAPNGISEPIEDVSGWNLVQVVEKRTTRPPDLESMRSLIHDQLAAERIAARSAVMRGMVARQIGMVYDTTQIAWASRFFQPSQSTDRDAAGVAQLTLNTALPEFSMADTARVLATYRDGKMTLGRFMHLYTDIQPLLRPSVDTPEGLRGQVDGFVLEPYMAIVARERGLDHDSAVVADLATRREQLLIDHLYSDSILSRVVIDPKARRKYYEDNKPQFITWNRVRFAAMWAKDRPEADSLQARLKAGEKAEDILRADSLLGINRGSIQERAENEHGPYQKLLMEELRPGGTSVEGPDKQGHFAVLQELEYLPGHQLSYEDSEGMIDESLQNIESERLLNEFIGRHRSRYPIESHPELVMRVRLVDPTL